MRVLTSTPRTKSQSTGTVLQYNIPLCMACILLLPLTRSEIVATTTCVVLATLFINGGLTVQMCEWLSIETGVDVAAMTAKVRLRTVIVGKTPKYLFGNIFADAKN